MLSNTYFAKSRREPISRPKLSALWVNSSTIPQKSKSRLPILHLAGKQGQPERVTLPGSRSGNVGKRTPPKV